MDPVPSPPTAAAPAAAVPVVAGPPADPPAAAPEALDLDAVTAELAAVDAALARLDEGRYGLCAACDAPIADEVLAADPTATTCTLHAPT